jgi:uncharacterized SAM-binding protein YcdF (DUF218 family)
MLGRWALRLFAALGLLYALVTITPIDRWWIALLSERWNAPRGDILIVLGAESLGDAIGFTSYLRSVYAARAWREGGFRQVLVVGGSGPNRVPVSQLMKEFLICQGVPSEAIAIEVKSGSTRENALNAAPLPANGSKVLLTSDIHMYRAWRAFRKAGVETIPSPFPDAAKRISFPTNRWAVFIDLCAETLKIGYYRVRGWI